MIGRPWMGWYVLRGHEPEPCADPDEFARLMGSIESRTVAKTEVAPGVVVSTVFLCIDHNHGGKGRPILFETMVFDDYDGGDQWRYATWEEAEEGHELVVEALRKKMAAATVKGGVG